MLITRPEESYRLWCVIVCDLETSRMRRPWPFWAAPPQNIYIYIYIYIYVNKNVAGHRSAEKSYLTVSCLSLLNDTE